MSDNPNVETVVEPDGSVTHRRKSHPRGNVWRTSDPAVLALWAKLDAMYAGYNAKVKEVSERTRRDVYSSRGLAVGLSTTPEERRQRLAPTGWKWGGGDRHSGYMQPRAKGPGTDEAKALVREMNDLAPRVRERMRAEFGVPDLVIVGMRWLEPGLALMEGHLYVVFGTGEGTDEWAPDPEVWEMVPLSVYFAVKERQPVKDEENAHG